MNARRNRGLTLIEMMIVVLIISILVGIAIPSFMTSREKARSRACTANLRQINQAKEQFAMAKSLTEGNPVTASDLQGYLREQNFPVCPSDGTYTINNIGELPTCSVGNSVNPPHVFTPN